MLMPKKKKSDNWQPDYPEKEKKKQKKGQSYWQRCCPKKKGVGGNVATQGKEKKEKMQLKLRVFV